jgi:hypothetical protein
MLSKALASQIADFADHAVCGLCFAHHGLRIQQALAVCQARRWRLSPCGESELVVHEFECRNA